MTRVYLVLFGAASLISPALLAQAAQTAKMASAERVAESPLSAANLLETAAGLVLVLALILALAWLVRRMGRLPGSAKGAVQIVGGVSLGPRERAVVLVVEGVRLLVGVAPGRVQTLHVLGSNTDAAAHAGWEEVVAFSDRLEQAARTGRDG